MVWMPLQRLNAWKGVSILQTQYLLDHLTAPETQFPHIFSTSELARLHLTVFGTLQSQIIQATIDQVSGHERLCKSSYSQALFIHPSHNYFVILCVYKQGKERLSSVIPIWEIIMSQPPLWRQAYRPHFWVGLFRTANTFAFRCG